MNWDFDDNGRDLYLEENRFTSRRSPVLTFSSKNLRNYGGDIGLAAAAAVQAASNVFSWAQALLLPAIQAEANLLLMDRQKSDYDKIAAVQRQFLTTAINNYINGVESLLPSFQDAYPDIPQAAEYTPVDPCCVQGDTIECNIRHIARADVYAGGVNRAHEQQAIVRAIAFDPRFLVNIDMVSMQISDLLRGVLPIGDAMEVLTDRAEQDALLGRVGSGGRKLTPRDLGLSKLRQQALGREEFRRHCTLVNGVLVMNKPANIEDLMQTPSQRIALALTQAQLIQNSLQNLYNRNAQKAPYLMAQLETKLNRLIAKLQIEAAKGTIVNNFVPNYAAILAPMVKSVASAIGESIPPASKNHFYGPPGSQDGFTSQKTSGSNSMGTTVGDVENGAIFSMD